MKRENYLDYAKGFATLCLLFSHTMNTSDYYIGSWITSFHMPIFFIIGGIIHSLKGAQYTTGADIVKLIQKRTFQLGVPYLVFGGILTLFYTALSLLSGGSVHVFSYLISLLTLQGIDSLWFIPCYYMAELLLSLANLSKKTRWGAIVLCACTVCYLAFAKMYPSFWLYRLLLKMIVSFSFMLIGFFIGLYRNSFKMPVTVSLMTITGGAIGAIINDAVGIGSLQFNHVCLFYSNASITSVALLSLFKGVEQKAVKMKLLSLFGRESIVVLCTNNLLIETIRLLDYKITGNFLLNHGLLGCLIFTGILVILEYGIVQMSRQRFIGLLFGKIR